MHRGEIYMADLDPVRGHEQHGRRPVLVISDDRINSLPLVITVVPGTRGSHVARDFPWNVRIPAAECGLRFETVFMCFQVRALDKSRFPSVPISTLSDAWMKDVEAALKVALGVR